MSAVVLPLVAAYLIGSIPFGYLIGRMKGVDLFTAGSGNIGATNVGRVLGRKYAVLAFVLDFAKGAGPVAAAVPLAQTVDPSGQSAATDDAVRVGAAALAFLGHLFPLYLGFRGGKGVATGAGTVVVLTPVAAGLSILAWVTTVLASRAVSLASLAAVAVLSAAHLLLTPRPFADGLPVTLYCLLGSLLVAVKHRANVRRLLAGTENRVGDSPLRHTTLRTLHVLAVGFWFGGAGFFNFVAAPAVFESFTRVVNDGPSDRTAHRTIISPVASEADRKALASALAGSAVGPIFPRYFAMQAVCGVVALVTALAWWNAGGRVHRVRVLVLVVAVLTVAVGWPVSNHVSELRLMRFDPDPDVAAAAKAAFANQHLVSLLLSFVTTTFAGVALALAARLPAGPTPEPHASV